MVQGAAQLPAQLALSAGAAALRRRLGAPLQDLRLSGAAQRGAQGGPVSRIFISYRSADGADKATALARELGAEFGTDQVFLDKDDLRGGSTWREEIARTLDRRPVLLMLMTPMYLGARHTDGRLRIEDDTDPVRLEFTAALRARALIIPLLCDGLESQPDLRSLPAPFGEIGERTWRKLRAYDWKADVQRLHEDLAAAGVPRRGPRARAPAPAWRGHLWTAVGACVMSAILGLALYALPRGPGGDAATAQALAVADLPPTSAGRVVPASAMPAASAVDLSGEWIATDSNGSRIPILIRQEGGHVTLTSRRVPIAINPDWEQYRAFWQERTGARLDEVVYRGEGTASFDPVLPSILDAAIQVVSADGDGPLDTGNLHLSISPDGRQMSGELWLNSEQAAEAVVLVRAR
ncbi:MAG: toll/interleukin-1 receptor domain-containing protein [Aquabacterium sp.]|nr:MAG: toll/interleukin-1 receptor domain-containing protein [Aquabacterium sp.]